MLEGRRRRSVGRLLRSLRCSASSATSPGDTYLGLLVLCRDVVCFLNFEAQTFPSSTTWAQIGTASEFKTVCFFVYL